MPMPRLRKTSTVQPSRKLGRPRKAPAAPLPEDQPIIDEFDPGDDGMTLPGEDAAPATRSVIKAAYKREHVIDELGQALCRAVQDDRGKVDMAKLREVALQNGVWSDRYATLNPGMARMVVGNRLRAKATVKKVRWLI
jgi:hypothetical protein